MFFFSKKRNLRNLHDFSKNKISSSDRNLDGQNLNLHLTRFPFQYIIPFVPSFLPRGHTFQDYPWRGSFWEVTDWNVKFAFPRISWCVCHTRVIVLYVTRCVSFADTYTVFFRFVSPSVLACNSPNSKSC